MKIVVQGWFYDQPYTGIGQHIMGLTNELKKNNKVTIITKKEIPEKKWLLHPSVKKWYWERIQVPSFLRNKTFDLEYFPYPCPLPKKSKNKRAMTVHDLILLKDDRYRHGFIKKFYIKKSFDSLKNMDRIFTVSKTVFDELFTISDELSKDLHLKSATILPNAISNPAVKKKNKTDPDLLVYLGGYDIRKNVPVLVKAFDKLRQKNPHFKLVLIGKPHNCSKYYPQIPEIENLTRVGHVTDKNLYKLLSSAFAFLHFSDKEGFNISLLQSMAVGVPAIVNGIKVNREISNNSAIFIDISQEDPLTAIINKLKNKKFRNKIIADQKKAAQGYSWAKTAKIFLKAIK